MGDIGNIIREDYTILTNQVQIPVTNSIKKVLHPQTIKGHAESGHGTFRGNMINLSFREIFTELNINPNAAASYRETLCYEIIDFVDNLIEGKTKKLVNKNGAPLLRFEPAEKIIIQDKKAVIKGIVLAGRMDSNKWREKTVNNYLTNLNGELLIIGHGEEKIVNVAKMRKYGLTERLLSKKIHTNNTIAKYTRSGIFAKRGETKGIEKMFIRTAPGLGCCDDSSILSMGLIHGPEAIWGGWVNDGIDTYSKFIKDVNICGLDELIGEYAAYKWKEKYNENIVTNDESMQIIYLGYEKQQPRTTIENHYIYAESNKRPEKAYKLGFDRLDSNKFYDAIESRFNKMGLENLIPKKTKTNHILKKLKKWKRK